MSKQKPNRIEELPDKLPIISTQVKKDEVQYQQVLFTYQYIADSNPDENDIILKILDTKINNMFQEIDVFHINKSTVLKFRDIVKENIELLQPNFTLHNADIDIEYQYNFTKKYMLYDFVITIPIYFNNTFALKYVYNTFPLDTFKISWQISQKYSDYLILKTILQGQKNYKQLIEALLTIYTMLHTANIHINNFLSAKDKK